MKQGNGEESKTKGVTAENESVLVSHKEKKSTSDSPIEMVPLKELKNKKKPSTGSKSDPELQETTVSESKPGLSENRKGEEKCGGSGRESKKPSDCVDKEPGARSKLFPLSLGKQTTEPPVEEQLGEKSLKSCGDKETREKDCTAQKNSEMKLVPKEDAPSPAEAQWAPQRAALRGGAEATLPKAQLGPGLPRPPREASDSDSDSDEVQFVSYSSGKSEPEKSVEIPSGKSGKSVQGTSLPEAAASRHMEGPKDPKVLHNHLVVQLKQKKVIYCTCYLGNLLFCFQG